MAGSNFGIRNSLDMYVAILRSQTVTNQVISKLHLRAYYNNKPLYETRLRLNKNIRIDANKQSGLITISASDRSPDMAAKIANEEILALSNVLNHLTVTDAQKRKLFFANEISKIKIAIAEDDKRFRALSASGGLPITAALADSNVRSTATLQAQINAKEVEISELQAFATNANPQAVRLRTELAALRAQLHRLQLGGSSLQKASPTGEAAVGMLRDLQTQQALLKIMAKQYEVAKIDEAREGPLLQEIQPAHPPEHKSWPKRALIVVFSTLFGLVTGLIIAIARDSLRRVSLDLNHAADMRNLRDAWRWR